MSASKVSSLLAGIPSICAMGDKQQGGIGGGVRVVVG